MRKHNDVPARSAPIVILVCFLIFIYTAARKLIVLEWMPANRARGVACLALIGILFLTWPILARRLRGYAYLYFPIQVGLILYLGTLRPYEDNWAFLFVILALQIPSSYSRRTVIGIEIVFSALMVITMSLTQGLLKGFGFSLTFISIGSIILSLQYVYQAAEEAQTESQKLLAELQQAHQKLQEQAAQAQELAAVQERNRLTHDLHDSVSQIIFSVMLTSQSARRLLEKDPARLPEQLDTLQELTGSALSRMRLLISQWRPVDRSS